MFTKKRQFLKLISLNKKEQKVYIYILSICLLSLYSLFQSNTLYMDDYWRLVDGNTGWDFNVRPLATQITLLLQLGRPFTDISPLPQIIGIALYVLGIIYIARIFKIDNLLFLTLSGIVFVLNPYNLSLYSFTFDSFCMGLAVFCSLSSFCLSKIGIDTLKHKNYSIFAFLSSIILLITCLCLYQPISSFYLVSFVFYLLIKLCEEVNLRSSLVNFLIYLTVLLLSFLAYIPIKNNYTEGAYTSKYSQLPTLNQIPKTITQNIIHSWDKMTWDLQNNIIFFLMIGLLILIGVNIIIQIINHSFKRKKNLLYLILSLLLGIFYYFLLVCSFIFPSLILVQPAWSARIFTGFTAVVGMGCLFLVYFWSASSKFSWLRYILVFYISLIVLSFTNLSLTYGNVIHHQNLYEQKIGTLIIADIEEASIKSSIPLDQLKVTFANTERIKHLRRNILNLKALEKYPILSSLAYPYFTTDNFGIDKFKTFGLDFEALSNQEFIQQNKGYYIPTNEPIITRQLYDIYLEKGDTFVISFK